MAKPVGRPRSDRDDATVKLDRAITEKAKLVALRRRMTLAELLSETLRAPIEKAYEQERKRLAAEGAD